MDRVARSAWRIALPYLAVGLLWIVASDWALDHLVPAGTGVGQTVKGFVFVGVTAALIYGLTARELAAKREATEQRLQLERRLAATERFEAMGQLTSGVAHDFNNVLTAITGRLEASLSAPSLSEAVRAELEEAHRSAVRGAELTRQLLAVGRGQVLEPQSLDLAEVLGGMSGLLHSLIGKRVAIRTEPEPDLWPVHVDRGGLEQVVLNLSINARDAMPDGGELAFRITNQRVSAEDARTFPFPFLPGDYVRLDVVDTGIGIEPDVQRRIFEPFFTTKPKGVGTGLGLATVYGIIKQSGGYLTVESTPGKGSTFSVYLARTDEATEAAGAGARAGAGEPDDPRQGSETVLLVDDDPAVRSFAARALQRNGYRVLAAAGPREALELLRSANGRIHMLITDETMPGMSGTRLIESARSLDSGAKSLLISGHPERAVDLDVPYLAKPFSASELTRRVRQVLDA
jgi:two-component system, cell cycle sensor histidine kinase and response regulator CckA